MIKVASKNGGPTRIFVLDGQADEREWLVEFLSTRGYSVRGFADARAFERAWKPVLPRCVLCDLDLPRSDGFQVLRWLREQHRDVPVIGLTAGSAGVRAVADAMRLGALDVLGKPVSDNELLRALGEVEAGSDDEPPRAQELLARLSPREREVLDLVAEGLTSRQIALRLGLSKRTVDIHRGKLLRKLEASSTVDLVKIHALRKGSERLL